MDQTPKAEAVASDENSAKVILTVLWIVSVIAAGFIGYGFGSVKPPEANVLQASDAQLDSNLLNNQQASPAAQQSSVATNTNTDSTAPNDAACTKTGLAQKWEYLTAYEVQANDTLQSIATQQLKDSSRVNEILQINGVGPLVVGYTLYLPPSNIPKSSGNLKQAYGKLREKNEASWHLGFSNDPKGQGILIPAFLFDNVPNKDSYKPGDCLTIFFDDGYTVYSVAKQ